MSCSKRRGSYWSTGVLLSGSVCFQNLGGTLMIVWDSQPSVLQHTHYVSYFLLCSKLPHTYWLKTTNVYYLTVPMGEKFGSNLAVWFWLRLSHEVLVQLLAGLLPSSEGWTGAGGATSERAHLMAVGVWSAPHWLLAGGMGSLWHDCLLWLFECLPYMAELPRSEWSSERSDKRESRWRSALPFMI